MSITKKIVGITKNIHFQSLLGNGVMAVFGLVINAILYRTLTTTDVGIYMFFLVVFGLVDTARSGFLTFAFVKFYSGEESEKAKQIAGSTWSIAIISTTILAALSIPAKYAFAYFHSDDVVTFLEYFPWLFIVGLPFFMATLITQGDKRFDKLLWLRIANQLLFFGAIVWLTFAKKANISTVLMAYTLANAGGSLFAFICGWTGIGLINNTTKYYLKKLFDFGKFSFGTSLSATLFRVTDVFFLEILGKEALAVYFLGGRLLQIIEIPLSSFVSSAMPQMSGYFNHDEHAKMMAMMKKMTGLVSIALMIVAIGSIIFAEPIIYVIGGPAYVHTAAPNLFRLFMSIAAFAPIDRFFAVTMDVIHKPKVNFYKILVMLVANLLGDYIGITVFHSVYAIVLAGLLPLFVAVTMTYIPLNKYYPFSIWSIYSTGIKESKLLLQNAKQMFSGNN